MFKIGNYNSLYATKEVFDVFFCRNNKIEFATCLAQETSFSIDKSNKYLVLEINCGNIGNIEDYFLLLDCVRDPAINKDMDIYLRGEKIVSDTGEQKPLCLQVSNIHHCKISKCGTKMTATPSWAEYKIKIYFKTKPMEISSENCPSFEYNSQTFERFIEYKNEKILF